MSSVSLSSFLPAVIVLALERPARAARLTLFLCFSVGCVLFTSPGSAQAPAAAGPLRPLAAADSQWVETTLASLTLRQKAGQMLMPWTGGDYVALDSPEFDRLREWVERNGVGGLILSIGLPHSYAAKLNALQKLSKVPLLVAADMESGPGMRLAGVHSLPHLLPQGGGTVFPPAMAFGATADPELAYQMGRVTGIEARAVGVHMTFGPVLDVNSNPLNPIINIRSFGEDPARVGRFGAAYIRGAHEAGLLAAAKHFPGHGDTETDSHLSLPAITAGRARLDAIELGPFRDAVAAGVDGIMAGHIALTGIEGADAPPASLSPLVITRILRREMCFQGLVFTDAMNMGAVTGRYGAGESLIEAIKAGADVLLMPLDVPEALDAIVAATRDGRITEARIDASVRRILAAKARAGLATRRLVDLDSVARRVGGRDHTRLADEVARRSITLVRDREGRIPLRTPGRILSVTYAEPNALLAGREFNTRLAEHGWQVDPVRVEPGTSAGKFEALGPRVRAADVVLVSAYIVPREYRGSVAGAAPFTSFVNSLADGGVPLVVLSFGSPYLLGAFPEIPAYLLAWGGADVSQRAAARALLGVAPITGTLPVSLPAAGGRTQRNQP